MSDLLARLCDCTHPASDHWRGDGLCLSSLPALLPGPVEWAAGMVCECMEFTPQPVDPPTPVVSDSPPVTLNAVEFDAALLAAQEGATWAQQIAGRRALTDARRRALDDAEYGSDAR